MSKQSLKTSMTALLLIPVVGLLLVAGNSALQKYQSVKEMERINNLTNLAVTISSMVHEMQKERGLTAGYLGSSGSKFSRELDNQKPNTDTAIADLEVILSSLDLSQFGQNLKREVESGTTQLSSLSQMRSQVSGLNVTPKKAIGFYTKSNTTFLNSIATISHETGNGKIVGRLAAYVNFLKSKEQAGIERAVLTGVFAKDSFGQGEFEKFIAVVTRQDAYIDAFKNLAITDNIKFYQQTLSGSDVDAVSTMRQVALNQAVDGEFGINPESWFKRQTGKINLLKEVENHLSHELQFYTDDIKSQASKSLVLSLVVMFSLSLATMLIGFFSIRSIVKRVTNNIDKLSIASASVSTAGQEVSSSSESIASGASEQASSLEEIAASLEEMSAMTGNNSNNAQEMTDSSRQAASAAKTGLETMGKMNGAIERIHSSSSEMEKTLKTIDAIASQTNLLALNAAVEAARAGDAGKGFAVVAEEVRSLALRCSDASKDISVLVTEAIDSADMGTKICAEVNSNLAELATTVEGISELASEVAKASVEQAQGIDQLNEGVNQLDLVTQANAAAAEESAASSSELHRQANEMGTVVSDITTIITGEKGPNASAEVAPEKHHDVFAPA